MAGEILRDAISEAYLADEDGLLDQLIAKARLSPGESAATNTLARDLVSRARKERHRRSGVDAFTQEYALSSEEGVVLMCLAEALLRVPDSETADQLIRDKIAGRGWAQHRGHSESQFVNASTWALMLTGHLVHTDPLRWDFDAIWRHLAARLGEPIIRQAVTHAVRLLGRHFVLGRTIEEALTEAQPLADKGYRFSFDMLGEAAHTQADAERYLENYRHAVHAIAAAGFSRRGLLHERPTISVKLTALHPRFEYAKRHRVMVEMVPALVRLCAEARDANLGVTIDAENAELLDLTLDVFAALMAEDVLKGWNGLGIAVQAYQKRALPVIAWLGDLARREERRIPVRLVKGAYWDTEIKQAQELGLSDYPVFTRKAGTDTSYLACARALLADRDAFYPQFATHNAHTLATVNAFAGRNRDFEYQRLHGMGEAVYELYEEVIQPTGIGAATRIYAPVGSHRDLLAYLVRRLLENGANTSFVNRLANDKAAVDDVVSDPVKRLAALSPRRNPRIPRPEAIFPERRNAAGLALSDPYQSGPLLDSMQSALAEPQTAHAIVGGEQRTHVAQEVRDPADRTRIIGTASEASEDDVQAALDIAAGAQPDWDRAGGAARADILERAADLFEANRAHLMGLVVREAGRTVHAALAELRETVDFLRYYVRSARSEFEVPVVLAGPAGERNELRLHGRGIFACIAPWNFPLSIFTGQVAAALGAGNAALAKPAEQTPLVAAAAIRLLLEAGVPPGVLHFLPGEGARLAAGLLSDPRLAGVAFTGSTATAARINRALAARSGPLPALIAETGGLNAMIVDSTALPEQVTRDVLTSAFDSAGQRCSSLRLLFLQNDIADDVERMILGAMDEITVGDPFDLATDVGPIIDEQARADLAAHAERMTREATLLRAVQLDQALANGVFFAPHAFALDNASLLKREVFGPILHIVRYAGDRLPTVCETINATGYGLTLGIHSRINATADYVRAHVRAGNVYVNRNQIGAVVEAQPFGGEGLSGTGPKAGGPNYLAGFAYERSYTVNTAAAGGSPALLTLDEG